MKISAIVLWIACSLVSTAFSKTFVDSITGATVSAPDSWIHDAEDLFGYLIRDPKAKRGIKVRIHPANANFKTPEEAAAKGLENINKKRGGRPGYPKEDLLYSKFVVTKSGLKGYLAAHGFRSFSPVPYINHYYFKSLSGRIFCVCVYTGYDQRIASEYEDMILKTLTVAQFSKS
ncbi:MAG TPA: hypothetical protein VIM61_05120 [Chthoniobacterales bacterium]